MLTCPLRPAAVYLVSVFWLDGQELNLWPPVYKTGALPLSYRPKCDAGGSPCVGEADVLCQQGCTCKRCKLTCRLRPAPHFSLPWQRTCAWPQGQTHVNLRPPARRRASFRVSLLPVSHACPSGSMPHCQGLWVGLFGPRAGGGPAGARPWVGRAF